MTDLKEYSEDVLAMEYRSSGFDRIFNLAAGILLFAPVVIILLPGVDLTPVKGYEAFVPPFLIIVVIGFLTGAFFFVSQVFDCVSYNFDKRTDVFQISGRRYLYKKIKAEGQVSEIVSVSCEIYGLDEGKSSEIFPKYRLFGSGTETVKCGSRDDAEDVLIANSIEGFIK